MNFGKSFFVSILIVAGLGRCTYARDRGMDFLDMFHLSAGVGVGLGTDLTVCDNWGFALGILSEMNQFGYQGRWVNGKWTQVTFYTTPVNLPPEQRANLYDIFRFAAIQVNRTTDRINLTRITSIDNTGRFDTLGDVGANMNRYLGCDAGISLVLVSVRIGYSVGETVDFFTGLFGWDMLGDDGFTIPDSFRRENQPQSSETARYRVPFPRSEEEHDAVYGK